MFLWVGAKLLVGGVMFLWVGAKLLVGGVMFLWVGAKLLVGGVMFLWVLRFQTACFHFAGFENLASHM